MKPIVDGLEETYGGEVAFLRLDVAREGRELFQRYKLRGHPAYVVLDGAGRVRWQLEGQVPREVLEEGLLAALE